MKKLLLLPIMLLPIVGMVLGQTLIDDFNNPNGAITTSSTNNLTYNYNRSGCAYLNNEGYCSDSWNTAKFDYQDNWILSFDLKETGTPASGQESRFAIGHPDNLTSDYTKYLFALKFVPEIGVYTKNHTQFYVYNGGESLVANITETDDLSQWSHYELYMDNTTKTVNITIDDVYMGNFSWLGEMPSTPAYVIQNFAGASLYIDNITYTDSCSPDWACAGYGSCNTSDLAPCNSATDNNACGENYTGDYSEFSPQACNYCSSDVVYVTETGCHAVTDLKTVYYTDNNFETCCNVTSLPADCPQNESLVGIETSCSFFNYDEDDIQEASIDVIAKGFINASKWMVLVAGFLFVGVMWYFTKTIFPRAGKK